MNRTPRQRLHAVLEGKPTDLFPVVIPYLDIYVRDHWEEATNVPWWSVCDGNLDANFQVIRDVQERLALDWVPVHGGASRAWRERHRVELRDGLPMLVDLELGKATPLRRQPVGGDQHLVRTASVKSEADAKDAVRVVSASEMIAEGRFDLARRVIETLGKELFVVGSVSTPFWNLYFHFGFFELMTNLIERPRLVERLLEDLTTSLTEVVRAYAAIGYDGVWIEDCYASADLISPTQFRRFAAPYAGRLVAEVNRLGMKSIYYFCGEIDERLEDILAMNPHALALEESKKGFEIDIAKVDALVADRTCLFGNFDAITLLERGKDSEILAEIERQLAVGRKRGRFVLSLGSPVTPRTPTVRVRQWVDWSRERSSN